MAYDESKDKVIDYIMVFDGNVRVALFSYNGGQPKVGIQEKTIRHDQEVWQNVKGRKTKEDYYVIAKAIIELVEKNG